MRGKSSTRTKCAKMDTNKQDIRMHTFIHRYTNGAREKEKSAPNQLVVAK